MRNVYLIQPNYHSTFQDILHYWIPYSVGIIWSYAIQDRDIKNNYSLARIVYSREKIQPTVDSMENGAVYCFSNYIWNWEYNKTLAKKIKETYPNSYIVFGGPQVTNRPLETSFFKYHPYVDSVILGEGEESFAILLKNLLEGKKQKIYQSTRLENLDIPSPYLTGIFDNIINEAPDVRWHGTLETNRGCPFACTFCDWGSLIYSKVKKFQIDRVYAELEWMATHKVEYLIVADANFGIFKERDYDIAKKLCEVKKQYGLPNNININYNKNSSKEVIDIIKLFSESALSRGMTVSFQSMDETVLDNIKRKNLDINKAEEIFDLLGKNQLPSYSELILGLPGETLDSWKQGMNKLIAMGQHQCIDVFHATMLENSELNQLTTREKYNIQTVEIENFMHNISASELDMIPEKSRIVRSTNTMPLEDMVDSFMYSWMVVNLHCYGWSQIYVRFLNANFSVSYEHFYDVLFKQLINNKSNILSKLYYQDRDNLLRYFDNNLEYQKSISFKDYDILRDAQKELHKIKEQVEELLANFVLTEFKDLLVNIDFNKLKEFQKHYVASKDTAYPHVLDLDIGIQNSIFNKDNYVSKISQCRVDTPRPFNTPNDFLSKLNPWRRNGWGKTIITSI
jgi:radical SAM superfamily enzyme YgiQ (UPF0313 family)